MLNLLQVYVPCLWAIGAAFLVLVAWDHFSADSKALRRAERTGLLKTPERSRWKLYLQ